MFKTFLSEVQHWTTLCVKLPANWAATQTEKIVAELPPLWRKQIGWKALNTTANVCRHLTNPYTQPVFDIAVVNDSAGQPHAVEQVVVLDSDFAQLIHFKTGAPDRPIVVLVTALSGHFATLMTETVSTSLQDFDKYVVVWKDPRYIPVEKGEFDLDDYVIQCEDFFEYLGKKGEAHVLAVCQPGPAVLAAIARMAQRKSPYQPKSLTVMAAPMDTRASPSLLSSVSKLPLWLFELVCIHPVPSQFPGRGRKVYPGHLQLTGFILANPTSHVKRLQQYIKAHWSEDEETVAKILNFYREYFAVMPATAPFYLQTVDSVFLNHQLPKGTLEVKRELVDLRAITDLDLLAIAGSKDDFCPGPQTQAVLEMCTKLSTKRKQYKLIEGVGHYGMFSGSKYVNEIYPLIREFITKAGQLHQRPALELVAAA